MNTCKECNNTPPEFTEKVLEIINPEQPVLFHRVNFPASMGDDTQVLPDTLNYKNVLLYYEANKHAYLYSSDGVPTFISMGEVNVEQIEEQLKALGAQIEEIQVDISTLQQNLATEISSREEADDNLQQGITLNQNGINSLGAGLNILKDVEVQFNTTVSSNASTVTINKITGALGDEAVPPVRAMPLPVASETAAGVMNPATFKAVQDNSTNINSILGGAVALEGLPAEPTQEALTNAWQTATEQTQLINRASIMDITNQKMWYYYTNVSEWYSVNNIPEVTVATATNDSLGIVKGGDTVFVEPDGSLTVVGLDEIKSNIANLTELVDGTAVPKLPNSMVYDFVSPAGANNPSTADNANITARVVNTSTGAVTNATLMMPMASVTQAGSVTAADKSKLDGLANITSIGDNLTLDDDGVLSATGGGEEIKLYDSWGRNTDGALTQQFLNDKLRGTNVALGVNATITAGNEGTAIGEYAQSGNQSLGLGTYGRATGSNSIALLGTATGQWSIAVSYGAKASGTNTSFFNSYQNIAIGRNAEASNNGISIGYNALTNNTNSIGGGIALGHNSKALYLNSIALGGSSATSRAAELSIGYSGTNSEFTRYIAHVKAGTLPTDAVNKQQLDASKNRVWQSNTAYTAGELITNDGNLYSVTEDFTSGEEFDDTNLQSVGGGSDINLYNTWGTNTDGALTQGFLNTQLKGTFLRLGKDVSTTGGYANSVVLLGREAKANIANATEQSSQYNPISIGYDSASNLQGIAIGANTNSGVNIAIGHNASATGGPTSSVALGDYATVARKGEVSIGTSGTIDSSITVATRYLANVRAGELPTDAVNLAQLNEAVGNINTLLETLISGTGAN